MILEYGVEKKKPKVIKVRLKKCFQKINVVFTTEKGCLWRYENVLVIWVLFFYLKFSVCVFVNIHWFSSSTATIATVPSILQKTCYSNHRYSNCKLNTKQWRKWNATTISAHCSQIIVPTDINIYIYKTNHETLQICSIPYRLFGTENPHLHTLTQLRERYHQFLLYISIDKNININKWLNFIRKVVPK